MTIMKPEFQNVGVIGRVYNAGVIDTLHAVIALLKKETLQFYVEVDTANAIGNKDVTIIKKTDLSKQCDLVIVVGGDGSLLSTSHLIAQKPVPILGINRGTLGFLTDITPKELDTKLTEVLHGEYHEETRFMLDMQIDANPQVDMALNEVALLPKSLPHLAKFEIYINTQFLCCQRADGLIAATPTGSTAYALSGGGPILHPQLDAIALVPMFSHTLSMRPIVVEGESQIKIVVCDSNTVPMIASCDGQKHHPLAPGSVVNIQKREAPLTLIHPLTYDYYKALRTKLHWGAKPSGEA